MERPHQRPHLRRACLLWAALALPALTADRVGLNEPRAGWQQAAGLGVLAVAAALSRRRPLEAFAAVAVLSLASTPALFSVSYGPALAAFALLLGLRADRVRPAWAVFAAVGCAGTVRIALVGVDPAPEWVVLMCTLLFGSVFPWLGGRHWRQSRELAAAGWSRAARLEGEQRQARLRERARIAQDMHDSLGHELSLLALRAGALQMAPGLAPEHRSAVADLRTAAADATDRLHQIIDVLRDPDDPAPLTPPGETVPQLVARSAESGLSVRLDRVAAGTHGVEGAKAGRRGAELRPEGAGMGPCAVEARPEGAGMGPCAVEARPEGAGMGPCVVEARPEGAEMGTCAVQARPEDAEADPRSAVGRLLYRVVREGLTNAARHAPGAAVVVALAGNTVTVTNGRATRPHSVPGPAGGGSGLLGLRGAVTALGGEFEAGPYEDGFRVRAYVPEQPRRRAPLSITRAVALAASAGIVLIGGGFGWYAYTETHSVLTPSAYAALRPGTAAADLARVLPDRTVRDAPVERAPAPPPNTDCRYYRASGELLVSVDHFRLCFDDDGRLVTKDLIPGAGRTPASPEARP
ncbi:sensor histidine kinase [Streptomyces justiciae]|uniref:sensor histidine kinase n=1 Tax=Streptomyces justiciae TaxID=2780140 RepID=UPI0021182FEB|nr:histidine kinase [Streptomyces justiciae]MCW8383490.1 histidine kinase [Streptomyces justiciae]